MLLGKPFEGSRRFKSEDWLLERIGFEPSSPLSCAALEYRAQFDPAEKDEHGSKLSESAIAA